MTSKHDNGLTRRLFQNPTPRDWMLEASCASLPPETADEFFFPDGQVQPMVQKLCAQCPVVVECLQYGRTESHGVWAGMRNSESHTQQFRMARTLA